MSRLPRQGIWQKRRFGWLYKLVAELFLSPTHVCKRTGLAGVFYIRFDFFIYGLPQRAAAGVYFLYSMIAAGSGLTFLYYHLLLAGLVMFYFEQIQYADISF